MYLKLIKLELKNFMRNPQFGANIAIKILMFFTYAWLAFGLFSLSFGFYFYVKKELHMDPLRVFCKYFIYYWPIDLLVRYFMQQMPMQNIKPFLSLNISKKKLVNYTIIKTFLSFFNWGNLLFLLPFATMLIFQEHLSFLPVLMFITGILFVFYFNNFLNILLNGKTLVVVLVFGVIALFGLLEYYHVIHLSTLSEKIFYTFYSIPGVFLVPVIATILLAYIVKKFIQENFYLDKGLETKKKAGKTENIQFLNKYGQIGSFINNDIKLLRRSKAAQGAAMGGILFLFYGLLFHSPSFQNDFMKLFAGLFVTGGFLFMFGQRVPAWDSSYYPLMMTLNVPYKKYLQAKWWLIVLATFISILISAVYVFISYDFYLTIVAAGLYNLGVNSYLTLLAGAFNKKPVDLNSRTKSFGGGGGNNFNMKTMLMMIPQMLLPMIVFSVMKIIFGIVPAVISLGLLGLIGIFLRDKIFDLIVKVYKKEKYSTINAFKNV